MCSLLKLLTAVLVLVYSTQDGNNFLLGGKRDGTAHLSAGALCGVYDLLRSLVHQVVVIALQSDADLNFTCCHVKFLHEF